jgi:hypothetical protein
MFTTFEKTLFDSELHVDNHKLVWDGTDEQNKPVSSGVYFYNMNASDYSSIKKMILLK